MTTNELKHLKDTLTPSDLSQILWTRLSDRQPTAEDGNHFGDVEWCKEGMDEIEETSWARYTNDPSNEVDYFWRSIIYPSSIKPS